MNNLFDGLEAILNKTEPQSPQSLFAKLAQEKKRILHAFGQLAAVPGRMRDDLFSEIIHDHYTLLMDFEDDLILVQQPLFLYFSNTIGELRTFLLMHFDIILSNHIPGQDQFPIMHTGRPVTRQVELQNVRNKSS